MLVEQIYRCPKEINGQTHIHTVRQKRGKKKKKEGREGEGMGEGDRVSEREPPIFEKHSNRNLILRRKFENQRKGGKRKEDEEEKDVKMEVS